MRGNGLGRSTSGVIEKLSVMLPEAPCVAGALGRWLLSSMYSQEEWKKYPLDLDVLEGRHFQKHLYPRLLKKKQEKMETNKRTSSSMA